MDFMFEDEVDEVGSDVEAYCPKCKADTTHVVISKYEDEIRRVQCNPCGDVHSFRKPRGEAEDDTLPEPVAARKRALLKKPGWPDFFGRKNPNDAKPYEFRERYRENAMVNHPKFGVGFVSEVVSDSKVEITFKDARRILVHNRRDIPGLPLAVEGDGVPTPVKTTKAREPKEPKDAKEPREPKAEGKAEGKEPKGDGKPGKAKAAKDAPVSAEPKLVEAKPGKAVEAKPEAKAKGEGKLEKTTDKDTKPPVLKAIAGGKATKAPAKAEPAKGKTAAKAPAPKTGKAAAPRGGKTAAKPAAKKPAPKAKKKAGKKR